MKRTTVTLPETLAARMEEESRRRRVPVSQFVREAIESKLNERESGHRLSYFATEHAGGYPGGADTERYLQENWLRDLEDTRR